MIGHPAPLTGEFEQVIMIAVGDRRDGRVGLSSWRRSELKVGERKPTTRAKWRSSTSAYRSVRENCLRPPTLLEIAISDSCLSWPDLLRGFRKKERPCGVAMNGT